MRWYVLRGDEWRHNPVRRVPVTGNESQVPRKRPMTEYEKGRAFAWRLYFERMPSLEEVEKSFIERLLEGQLKGNKYDT